MLAHHLECHVLLPLDTHKSRKLRFSYSRCLAELLRTKERKNSSELIMTSDALFSMLQLDFAWYFPLSKLKSNLPTLCEQVVLL